MKIIFVLISIINAGYSARILGVFLFPSLSHIKVFNAISKALSENGHEMIMLTPNPTGLEIPNLKEVNISVAYNIFNEIDITNASAQLVGTAKVLDLIFSIYELCFKTVMKIEAIQELMKKPDNYFDLLLVESHSPLFYSFQYKFKAPLIAVSSLGTFAPLENIFGNPVHPVLYPDSVMTGGLQYNGQMTLSMKIYSLYISLYCSFYFNWILVPRSDEIAKEYFGQNIPYIKNIVTNTSLLLLNVNPILSAKKPSVPNIIYFYDIHRNLHVDPLPNDLQQILDNAKNGVVYFSLGTNVRFDHVEKDFKNTVLRTLGELPYTVLCKWESEDYPGKPKNVVLRKWFPQQSVLAHPNIKVFVTQGGLQSSEEAIINAVPLVIIPFLGDQPMNARILTSHGMAETIQPNKLTQEDLKETIMKVATEEKYHTRAKELREIFLDQPQSGLDKIVWWCEYVIRHKGAKHLRSPGADIPLYEYFMLDLLAVFIAALLVFYMVVKQLFKLMKYSFQYIKQKKD